MTGGRRRVLVTGGAAGIGASLVARFVALGDVVAVLDRDQDGLAALACAHGREVAAVSIDLADPGAIEGAVADAADRLGGIDVCINNAGVFAKTPLEDLDAAEWDRIMAVNARAPMLVIKSCLAHLPDGHGRVINIASMAATRGTPGEAAYAASKAALVALTRIAAMELGPRGVTVNAVCPGYVLTEMGAATRTDAQVQAWQAQSPLGRLASPEDVANVVVWLASDAASYLTGQAVHVTGGMVMGA